MTHEELAAKTRKLIQDHSDIMDIAEDVPVYEIDENYLTKVRNLPSPGDRAAELEAALHRELIEGDGFIYKQLGERLQRIIELKNAGDRAAIKWLEELVEEINKIKTEPQRFGLTEPGEYPLFTVIRQFSKVEDEKLCVRAAKSMMAQLKKKSFIPQGWSGNKGGVKNVRLTLQVASWDSEFEPLELCPTEEENPPFLQAAVEELARALEKDE